MQRANGNMSHLKHLLFLGAILVDGRHRTFKYSALLSYMYDVYGMLSYIGRKDHPPRESFVPVSTFLTNWET